MQPRWNPAFLSYAAALGMALSLATAKAYAADDLTVVLSSRPTHWYAALWGQAPHAFLRVYGVYKGRPIDEYFGFVPDDKHIWYTVGHVSQDPQVGDLALYTPINDAQYEAIIAEKDAWASESQVYGVLHRNCVDLVDRVANTIGLTTPGAGGKEPIAYMEQLLRANAGRIPQSQRPTGAEELIATRVPAERAEYRAQMSRAEATASEERRRELASAIGHLVEQVREVAAKIETGRAELFAKLGAQNAQLANKHYEDAKEQAAAIDRFRDELTARQPPMVIEVGGVKVEVGGIGGLGGGGGAGAGSGGNSAQSGESCGYAVCIRETVPAPTPGPPVPKKPGRVPIVLPMRTIDRYRVVVPAGGVVSDVVEVSCCFDARGISAPLLVAPGAVSTLFLGGVEVGSTQHHILRIRNISHWTKSFKVADHQQVLRAEFVPAARYEFSFNTDRWKRADVERLLASMGIGSNPHPGLGMIPQFAEAPGKLIVTAGDPQPGGSREHFQGLDYDGVVERAPPVPPGMAITLGPGESTLVAVELIVPRLAATDASLKIEAPTLTILDADEGLTEAEVAIAFLALAPTTKVRVSDGDTNFRNWLSPSDDEWSNWYQICLGEDPLGYVRTGLAWGVKEAEFERHPRDCESWTKCRVQAPTLTPNACLRVSVQGHGKKSVQNREADVVAVRAWLEGTYEIAPHMPAWVTAGEGISLAPFYRGGSVRTR